MQLTITIYRGYFDFVTKQDQPLGLSISSLTALLPEQWVNMHV